MSLYSKGNYWNDLQLVAQPCTAVTGRKSKSLVVAQSHEVFQLVFWISWNPGEVGSNRCAGSKCKQAKKEVFLLPLSLCRPPASKGMAQIKGVTTMPRPNLFFTWNLLCPRLAFNSEICLPLSIGINGVYHLAWA